ncbi:Protein Y57G11C.38, partial [Aphelenchoides avenae]
DLKTLAEPLPTAQNLTCFMCGVPKIDQRGVDPLALNISCDGESTCSGGYCITRKATNPRSYCATSWDGTLSVGCTKHPGEDELCVCTQSMCNYPYDPLLQDDTPAKALSAVKS